ncbi:hypothetical protein SLEP1_g43919 [Rubroshorea leprosula]|uniref:Uncharacterized protein n=1 Tax=Rubroshorea leprosula TaxID=152421 RepID=A0AAV5LFP8_9ROSI|nr:hypothetical protein SLEP1_g43919 [Rubroshorea leprosula]
MSADLGSGRGGCRRAGGRACRRAGGMIAGAQSAGDLVQGKGLAQSKTGAGSKAGAGARAQELEALSRGRWFVQTIWAGSGGECRRWQQEA